MNPVDAVVLIFGMFFCVILVALGSHHKLESLRLLTGYYKDNPPADEPVIPGELNGPQPS